MTEVETIKRREEKERNTLETYDPKRLLIGFKGEAVSLETLLRLKKRVLKSKKRGGVSMIRVMVL